MIPPLLLALFGSVAYYLWGQRSKPPVVGTTTPAWVQVVNATETNLKPANTASVGKVLLKLAKDGNAGTAGSVAFMQAYAAVEAWGAGLLTFDQYRARIASALPSTLDPSVKALLSVSLT